MCIPSDFDLHLFNEGTHQRLYDFLGARTVRRDGIDGVMFGVWAPNASWVSVVGDFNGWTPRAHEMDKLGSSGIWTRFVPALERGVIYKYHIESSHEGYRVDKADPFGVHHETPPATGSRVWDLAYEWDDSDWMRGRADRQRMSSPISVYELHAGSWMKCPEGGGRVHSYDELAELLPAYVSERGFTHVEFMPLTEHPLYRSWGYQTTGYFAPTARYGTPQGLMRLVDALHRAEIGVILDWVPSHFPSDEHGLGYFDGTHLFEHADPRQGFHPDWKSLIFNYGRHEVKSFLLSSAKFWLETYHIDGLRVDAVASMLYLDYSREDGEWVANEHGGRENLEAIEFLKCLNTMVAEDHPGVRTFAEESTSWPLVSRPVEDGGLGFGFKWDMGWMHDSLTHFARQHTDRPAHYNELTFRGMYMQAENYALPLSHDEVVHGKGSLIGKMPGDEWQRFANLRLLFANQWLQPGKKILFMGGEFAARAEWDEERELEWALLDNPAHRGIQRLVDRLNRLYRSRAALHANDADATCFRWIMADDPVGGVIAFVRFTENETEHALCVMNTRPDVKHGYRLGVPTDVPWDLVLNTDASEFGGSGVGEKDGPHESESIPWQGQPFSIVLTLPPLAAMALEPVMRSDLRAASND